MNVLPSENRFTRFLDTCPRSRFYGNLPKPGFMELGGLYAKLCWLVSRRSTACRDCPLGKFQLLATGVEDTLATQGPRDLWVPNRSGLLEPLDPSVI